jgi:hypothetical protein
MFDRRNLTSGGVGSPVHKFEGHNAAVLCVQVTEKFWAYFLDFILHMPFHYICRNRAYLVVFNENFAFVFSGLLTNRPSLEVLLRMAF